MNNKLKKILIILVQIFIFSIARPSSNGYTAVDTTPPITPIVIDDGQYTTTPTQLHGFWVSDDPDNVIVEIQYSIGTAPAVADVVTWTSAGTATEATVTGLFLNHGQTYYFNVKSKDSLGVWSDIGSSDGIIVNAHIPVINSITPEDNSTFPTKTQLTINVDAQDADGDPLEYRFLIDDKVGQDWSVYSSYTWTALPTTKLVRTITCQVRDDKTGKVSQIINYNVEIDLNDTTPPTTPQVFTDEHSNSLTKLRGWWYAEDPESGISEYQYAIGTFPGGTDVVDWTSAGTETEVTHYGLNLIEGQNYYFTVRAINRARIRNPEELEDLKKK